MGEGETVAAFYIFSLMLFPTKPDLIYQELCHVSSTGQTEHYVRQNNTEYCPLFTFVYSSTTSLILFPIRSRNNLRYQELYHVPS